jgi:hypothetical protein
MNRIRESSKTKVRETKINPEHQIYESEKIFATLW